VDLNNNHILLVLVELYLYGVNMNVFALIETLYLKRGTCEAFVLVFTL